MSKYMKTTAFILLAILSFETFGYSQTSRKKTDIEEQELSGTVHKVRLTRKLIMSLDGEKEFGDGWIPGLVVFNRDGYQELFEAYDDEGEFQYKVVSRFNSSGQKIEEVETKANGQRSRKRTFSYDKDGNQIGSNGYYGEEDKYNGSYRWIYDDKGFVTSIIESDDKNKIVSSVYYSRNDEDKSESTASYDGNGKLYGKTLESYGDKNRQDSETAFTDEIGNPTSRYTRKTDEKGNVTDTKYDAKGKVLEKEVYVYEYDSKGNWIKEEKSEWENKDGQLILKKKKETNRMITYF